MYAVAPSDSIYHIAKENKIITLCKLRTINPSHRQRRCQDYRLAEEPPKNRVCALCSKCAELSGDTRSFSRRIIYPQHSTS